MVRCQGVRSAPGRSLCEGRNQVNQVMFTPSCLRLVSTALVIHQTLTFSCDLSWAPFPCRAGIQHPAGMSWLTAGPRQSESVAVTPHPYRLHTRSLALLGDSITLHLRPRRFLAEQLHHTTEPL